MAITFSREQVTDTLTSVYDDLSYIDRWECPKNHGALERRCEALANMVHSLHRDIEEGVYGE